jgi:hypothetical protein
MSLTASSPRTWLIAGGALLVAFLAAFAIGSATKSDAGGGGDQAVKPLSTSSYAKPSVSGVAAPAALPAAAQAPKPKPSKPAQSTPATPTPSPTPAPAPSPSPTPSPSQGGGSSGGPVIEG